MTKLTIEGKKMILKLYSQGYTCSSIVQELNTCLGISVSHQTVTSYLTTKLQSLWLEEWDQEDQARLHLKYYVLSKQKCKQMMKLQQCNYWIYYDEVEYVSVCQLLNAADKN